LAKIINLSSKFHANPFGSFWANLLTEKQTNDDYISSLVEVNIGLTEKNHPNTFLQRAAMFTLQALY